MEQSLALNSARSSQARLGKAIGKTGFKILNVIVVLSLAGTLALAVTGQHYAMLTLALSILCYMPAAWWKRQLSVLPPSGTGLNERLSGDVLAALKTNTPQQPQAVWNALADHWQARFLLNHLLLSKDVIGQLLTTEWADLSQALQIATKLADQNQSRCDLRRESGIFQKLFAALELGQIGFGEVHEALQRDGWWRVSY